MTQPNAGTCQAPSYLQGFENNLDFWYNFEDSFFHGSNETFPPTNAVIERVPSGMNGIQAKSGSFFALVKAGDAYQGNLTPLSIIGGFSNVFPEDGIQVGLDIYLNPAGTDNGQTFSYTVALNKTDCEHIQDFVFHVGKVGGQFCVSTSNGAFTGTNPCTQTAPINLSATGWYSFIHEFEAGAGNSTDVTMRLLDPNGGQVPNGVWTGTVTQPGQVGGNRYAWFPVNTFPSVAIDNSSRTS